MLAETHPRENERLEALRTLELLDTEQEQQFDDIVKLASMICNVPTAMISLVDDERQWFKTKIGIDLDQTGREMSVCSHAILEDEVLMIPDTDSDARTADMPKADYALNMRFYAGAKIVADDDLPIGALCVIDETPRELTQMQQFALKVLSDQVSMQIRLRHEMRQRGNALNRKDAENASLQKDLIDQEMLNREIDHRVKNSLQLVTSMLRFQANATDNDEIQNVLEEAQNRVQAIASVHAELDQSTEEGLVNLTSYMTNLSTDLNASTPTNVNIKEQVSPLTVDAKVATSLAIIFNEFVANSVKYAFPNDRDGQVSLVIKAKDNLINVMLSDDGIGYGGSVESKSPKGLGMRIMEAAARQLGSDLTFKKSDEGTLLSFSFENNRLQS